VNFEIPGASLLGPKDYRVDLLQAPELSSGTNGAASYPPADLRDPLPMASSGPQVRIVLIPISYGADGSNRLPDTSEQQLQLYRNWFYGIYPTALVDIKVGSVVASSVQVDAWGGGWDTLLNTVSYFHDQYAAPDEYYYGLFAPAPNIGMFCNGGCVTGLSMQAGPTDVWARVGIGLGFAGEYSAQTAVHETGHMHGLGHAPCGNPDGVDPGYPYGGAAIGVWGYDLVGKRLLSPSATVDMMSYCEPPWISDYNFIGLFNRIRLVNAVADMMPPPASARRAYERVAVGPTGTTTWLEPLSLTLPPSGQPVRARVEVAGDWREVDGSWTPYSDLPGGVLLFPQPTTLPTKVELGLAGRWHTASRDQLTHHDRPHKPTP
jgi:hypothetical protein